MRSPLLSSKKATCLHDLRQRILSLDIPPGSDLDEPTLTDMYGISRTPLREVLQRLAGDGYIRITENRGAKVSSMDLTTMRTFFQTAPLIYATVARLAAENRQDAQLDVLREVQTTFADATRRANAEAAALANHRFHAAIGEMAANPYLTPALNRLLIDHTRMSQTFYRPSSDQERALVETACEQHEAMIAAIAVQEPARAVDLTLQHWDLSRDQMERFVRPDPLPLELPDAKDRAHAL